VSCSGRARPRGAVGPRRPARHRPQRCPGRVGRPARRSRWWPPTTCATPCPPSTAGHRAGGGAGPPQPGRDRSLAARRRRRPPALGAEQARRFARYPGVVATAAELGGRAPSTCAWWPRTCRPTRAPTASTRWGSSGSWWRRARPAPTATGLARPPRRRAPCGRGPGARSTTSSRHRSARLPRLLPHRLGHRAVLPNATTSTARAGVGGQQRGVLGAGHHQGRRRAPRPAVRAVPLARARRPARHRPRHRERPARGGDPVRLRALRPPLRRAGGQRHHLPGPFRGARHGQGARRRPGAAGCLVEAARPVEGGAGHR
jgi:hypothetical protein